MNNFDYSQEMYEDVANYYDDSMAEEKVFDYWTPSTILVESRPPMWGPRPPFWGPMYRCFGDRGHDAGTVSPQIPRPPRPRPY